MGAADFAPKRRDHRPKVIQHRIRRRMEIVPTPMHLTAGDHVDALVVQVFDLQLLVDGV